MKARGSQQRAGRKDAEADMSEIPDGDRVDADETAADRGRPGRGHLRIYLGSAAGVGKTYAPLGGGHRRAERGADVGVAFAETHGRPLTAALLDGLESTPRRPVT